MKLSKSYIKQVIREELDGLSEEYILENEILDEGLKDYLYAAAMSLALAAGAQAKPVTVTSEVDGVEKTFVVDAPDEASPNQIRKFLQDKSSERQAAKPSQDRKSVFIADVHESTPEELKKYPMINKSGEGGDKAEKPAAAQKSDAGAKKSGAAQATEVSSTGNTTVYKVTGAKDNGEAIQAAMRAKMDSKGGQKVTFNGSVKVVSDGSGGFTVTLTGSANQVKEGFYGRRFGGRSRSSYGSSYNDSYQKEEDPSWHARPGEQFKVPGRAKLYYWVMEGDQKAPYARTFSFYGRKGPSSDEVWKAFEAVQEKFGDKFAGLMKDRGEEGVEILSYPQEIEN